MTDYVGTDLAEHLARRGGELHDKLLKECAGFEAVACFAAMTQLLADMIAAIADTHAEAERGRSAMMLSLAEALADLYALDGTRIASAHGPIFKFG